MRDRQYDWALGPDNAAAKQFTEDCAAMDCLNTAISGFGPAERTLKDMDMCWTCDGHGCKECRGTGYSLARRMKNRY